MLIIRLVLFRALRASSIIAHTNYMSRFMKYDCCCCCFFNNYAFYKYISSLNSKIVFHEIDKYFNVNLSQLRLLYFLLFALKHILLNYF